MVEMDDVSLRFGVGGTIAEFRASRQKPLVSFPEIAQLRVVCNFVIDNLLCFMAFNYFTRESHEALFRYGMCGAYFLSPLHILLGNTIQTRSPHGLVWNLFSNFRQFPN